MNLFGIPLVGPDTCAIKTHSTLTFDQRREMCIRWSQLGAFYPFARNHNKIGAPSQDPTAFGASAAAIIGDALRVRYALLPYLYTLFFQAHTGGTTVARPLFFEFPQDQRARVVERQFLWGPALLITPVLMPGAVSVDAYLPPEALWWDYFTGSLQTTLNGNVTLAAPLDKFNLHVRGGFVIATQPPHDALTTVAARQRPFELVVALNHTSVGFATGQVLCSPLLPLQPALSHEICVSLPLCYGFPSLVCLH